MYLCLHGCIRLSRCYPDSACGAKPPALPSWATCADQDDAAVTAAARSIGITKDQYSCAKALNDGACGLAVAPQLCPVTCNLCPRPSAWTFIEGSPKSPGFCLASAPSCEFTTNCGGHVASASECETAGIELGLNGSVMELNDNAGPRGCFYVLDDAQHTTGSGLYWNANGSQASRFDFAKSICRWQNTTGFILPEPNPSETVNACGETHTLPVYTIEAQAFEAALGALRSKQIHRFMLRLGEGAAYVHGQVSFTGSEGGTVVVLAGAQAPHGSVPLTSIDLGEKHIYIDSGTSGKPISVCMQDLHLHNGKADRMGEEGGAIAVIGTLKGSVEQSSHAVRLLLLRCHVENCMSRISGGAVFVWRAKLKASHCVFRKNSAQQSAGAIEIYQSFNTSLDNCRFESNTAALGEGQVDQGGGSVYIGTSDNVIVDNCIFIDNAAGSSKGTHTAVTGKGGGMRIQRSKGIIIRNTLFQSNKARSRCAGGKGAQGGAICFENSEVHLDTSTLTQNVADDQGGAIWGDFANSGFFKLESSVVNLNRARKSGGGVYMTNAKNMMNRIISSCMVGNEVVRLIECPCSLCLPCC